MKNVISLVSTKPADLEFEVGIEGLSPSEVFVRLCIKTKELQLSFVCGKKKQDKWECHIPPLQFLEKGAYPYYIEVIADGYYFKPTEGTVNVSGTFDVYAKKPEKIGAPTIKKRETEKDNTEKETKTSEKKKTTSSSKKKPITKETVEPKKLVGQFQDLDSLVDKILKDKAKISKTQKESTEKKDVLVSKGSVVGKKEEVKPVIEKKKQEPTIENKKDTANKKDEIIVEKKPETIVEKSSLPSDDDVRKILERSKGKKPEKVIQKTEEKKSPVIVKKKTTPVVEKKETKVPTATQKSNEKKSSAKDDAVHKILEDSKTQKEEKKVTTTQKSNEKKQPVVEKKPVVKKKESLVEKTKTTKTGKGDDAIKGIIKNLSKVTESKESEKETPVVRFKKGKRVVN